MHAKYRGSTLGVLWTIANPLALMGVYLLVFSVVLNTHPGSVHHYGVFMLGGLAVWTFLAASLQASCRSMIDNANLIRKIKFPRQLLPLSVVGAHVVSFAAMLAALLALDFALLPRARLTEWLALPLAVMFVAMVCGLALALASLNALFRDVEFVVSALLLPWFFLTPVIYPLNGLKGLDRHPTLAWALHWLNPVTPAVQSIRGALFYGVFSVSDAIYLAVAAATALCIGAFVFAHLDDQIAIDI